MFAGKKEKSSSFVKAGEAIKENIVKEIECQAIRPDDPMFFFKILEQCKKAQELADTNKHLYPAKL